MLVLVPKAPKDGLSAIMLAARDGSIVVSRKDESSWFLLFFFESILVLTVSVKTSFGSALPGRDGSPIPRIGPAWY